MDNNNLFEQNADEDLTKEGGKTLTTHWHTRVHVHMLTHQKLNEARECKLLS